MQSFKMANCISRNLTPLEGVISSLVFPDISFEFHQILTNILVDSVPHSNDMIYLVYIWYKNMN